MANLKAGTADDFSASLAAYMERAMQNEWRAVKGEGLPAGLGVQDRRILFAAIAQGVLKFLYDHRHDISSTPDGGASHQHKLEFGVITYRSPLP